MGVHIIVWTGTNTLDGPPAGIYSCEYCGAAVPVGNVQILETENIADNREWWKDKAVIDNACSRCKKHVEDCKCPERRWPK